MKVSAKNTKLYIAGFFLLVLAVLVFVQAAFDLNPFVDHSSPNQIVLLVTVSTLIFLVLIVFGFVLARNLVKVWAERKQQKPGSQFKTSLLTTLIGLTLVPAALLFAFGYGLINRSIDKWFSVPVDSIFHATNEIGVEWRRDHEAMVKGILDYLAKNPPQDLDSARQTLQLKALISLGKDGNLITSSAEPGVLTEEIRKNIVLALGKEDEVIIQSDPYWI